VNAKTDNFSATAMRASDADRDAVVSDLSEHFQAGRLTAEEFDERSGQALTARTWGELKELLADLPGTHPQAVTPSAPRPVAPSGHAGPPLIAVLIGVGIATMVVVNVVHGSWGFLWLIIPMMIFARRAAWHHHASGSGD